MLFFKVHTKITLLLTVRKKWYSTVMSTHTTSYTVHMPKYPGTFQKSVPQKIFMFI